MQNTSMHTGRRGAATRQRGNSFWQRLSYSDDFWAYLFLLPTILGLILFSAGPVLAAGGISLTKWNIVDTPTWRGLRNYQKLFVDDLFWISLRNTLRYMLGAIPLSMLLSLALALALNQHLRFEALFRTIYFIPSICSVVALSLLWRYIFDRNMGLLNWFIGLFGMEPVPWLLVPRTAMPAVIIMSVWGGLGYPVVLWLAGLQGVPQVYYDAAQVDGAGTWARFRHITWPLITPTTFFMLVISCIGSFQVFAQTFVLTGGGPQRSTYTLVYFIYDKAFGNFEMSYACAIAYVLFFFVLVLTIIQFSLQARWVNYDIG